MALEEYQSKRKFSQTPEPKGKVAQGQGPLRFVVQKHLASRFHFDLRLEVNGTLKSWAVPKGPSLDPTQKRLAIQVEDHPLDYLLFEGTIPKGNYGAGTVMVWDEGTFHVPGSTNRQRSEQAVMDGFVDGSFHVILHGKKLHGEFILVWTKRPNENGWLLYKKTAGTLKGNAAEEDWSVLSGRTMEEISRAAPGRAISPRFDLSDAPKAAMPRNVKPMLATPLDEPFDRADWIFEVKWDGYRAIAEIESGKVRLYSRANLSFGKKFSPIVDSLQHLGHDAVLDGEVVALDDKGKSSFQLLQDYQRTRNGMLVYEVFDLLYLDGHDLRRLPLMRRKEFLAGLIRNLPNVRASEFVREHGKAFFEAVATHGLEGVVAKNEKGRYQQGIRSPSWLKVKTHLRQEAVIGGFTEGRGSRKGLGALVLGVYQDNELVYIGHAGSGFTQWSLADLRSRLDGLTQKSSAFKRKPKSNAPVQWVRPELVCEVSFAEWTRDGHMRHPVYLGLREAKPAVTVCRELNSLAKPAVVDGEVSRKQSHVASTKPKPSKDLLNGQDVRLTNLNKLYWPNEGYTKGDLIQYYRDVASVILPYLRDRPESLHRHPNGILQKSFFQKDVRRQPPPPWVQTVELPSEESGTVRTVLCQDERTLLYLANLGCIELNPWNSRMEALDRPDYVILDLDPESVSFDHVVEAGQAVHKVLQDVGADSVCKTSGKRGLHIFVPFGARYSHDQAKHFAELIARIVHAKLPAMTSLVRSPRGRQGQVYLDYLQNGKGKTIAAPYCARPFPGATVSTPLKWTEVRKGLDPTKFTIRTLAKRLDTVGDLWEPTLNPGVDLPSCIERLAKMLKRASA